MKKKIKSLNIAARSKTAKSGSKTDSKKPKNSEKIIITAALPYANGQIHIGHLLEYIQADVYARFLRLIGKDALYICASDMHGTPIEVNAKKTGLAPEKFASGFWKEHQKDFGNFLINFDNYYKTHSPENKELAELFFNELKKKKLIYIKKISTIYCEHCQRSLPDRFVKGTCPNCTTLDQYGDVCESCGSALKGIDLINPKCSLCGKTPVQKESEHYFFKLTAFTDRLQKWIELESSELQPEMKNWLCCWLKKGLEDWCVSRDEPYFGFEIPNSKKETGETKYFYVWLDAPIGYISSTKNYCESHKLNWKDYWYKGQVYHFIGKDIAYFHYLFWPAMLMAMEIPLPKLTVHGFITVNGEKMSKSRGTFFTAQDFLKKYSAESLRFYYASRLDRKVVDVDLNFEDFKVVNNNVLMGNLGNFCYRVLTFAETNYGSIKEVADGPEEKELEQKIGNLVEEIHKNYLQMDYKSAVRNILNIADLGNAYFQCSEVWKNKEDIKSKKKVGWCVNLARNLVILIEPVLPEFSEKIKVALGEKKKLTWDDIDFNWKGKLNKIKLLVIKIEHISGSSLFALRMVVGQIKEVREHPHADSLYLLKVDLGQELGTKQVVAGLKKHFKPEELIGRKVVFCANMKPAKIRGEMSEAMIFAADDHENVALLEAEKSKVGDSANFEGLENSKSEVAFEVFKKIKMIVSKGKVWFGDKKLATKVGDIKVHGVKDGSGVY